MGHADPECGIVVGGPITPGDRYWREIFVVKRTVTDFFECFRSKLYAPVRVVNLFCF